MKTAAASVLPDLVGTVIGVSNWVTVDQDRINQFADVTEDHQFIHINEDMAKMTPFGGTIAHGFLTLSLLSKFAEEAGLVIEGVKMGVNYGFEKVRFLAPVPSGSKVRGQFTLKEATEKKPGQFLLTYEVSVEIDGQEKPALIADWLAMQFTG
ncbi:MaoC family dehydratase [Hellea sp.]|nr:MaoC family dehydratase [Hellea sp.]